MSTLPCLSRIEVSLSVSGGLVSCRSVKLLEEGLEEDDIRDNWWTEIRREVRSHARALGCNLIVGYTEDTVIWWVEPLARYFNLFRRYLVAFVFRDDVVVLCAAGTAAQGNLSFMLDLEAVGIFGPPFIPTGSGDQKQRRASSPPPCSLVHLPYSDINLPYNFRTAKCRNCGKSRVPDVMFTTVEPPTGLNLIGRGCLLQAKVLRLKKDLKGESNAKEISDGLPFMEYEIHRQLINKLKVKGMNGLFGLKTKLSVSDRTIVATATATGAYISVMPQPNSPRLVMTSANDHDQQRLQLMQQRLEEKVSENVKYYELNTATTTEKEEEQAEGSESADCFEADLATGNKDTCVLEVTEVIFNET